LPAAAFNDSVFNLIQSARTAMSKKIKPFILHCGLLWGILFFPIIINAQQKVHGYVMDGTTGESLPGANVVLLPSGSGTTTNPFGYFSFYLTDSTRKMAISYIGYQTLELKTISIPDSTLFIKLKPGYLLDDIEIKATRDLHNLPATSIGEIKLRAQDFSHAGSILGEPDLMKTLQTLPGISQGKEGSSELYVRGGGAGHNLIMLDRAPVYNINHAFGLLSVFNVDALKETTIYKGSIPARFGGRLSSVVDVWGREGNDNNTRGSIFMSTVGTGLTLEGPYKKSKSSWLVSVRRSWPDLLYSGLQSLGNNGRFVPGISFHDINARSNFRIGNDRLFISFYSGGDKFFVRSKTRENKTAYQLKWGNYLGSAGYTSALSPSLFLHGLVYFSSYFDREESTLSGQEQNNLFERKSIFNELGAKLTTDWQLNTHHLLKTGLEGTQRWFSPASTIQENGEGKQSIQGTEVENGTISLFGESLWSPDRWRINTGFRLVHEFGENSQNTSILPRFSANYKLTPAITLKAGGMLSQQSFHVLSKSTSGWPGYFYVPVSKGGESATSKEVSSGLSLTPTSLLSIDVQAYLRRYRNIAARYEIPAGAFEQIDWDQQMKTGDGKSAGIEILGQYSHNQWKADVAYTLSKTTYRFEAYNNGKWFPGDYDRRHDFHFNLTFQLKSQKEIKRNINLDFNYRTGQPVTLPSAWIPASPPPLLENAYWYDFSFISHYSGPNNARMPDYHRLDITYETTKKKTRGERTLSFGLYNVYNRRNTYLIYYDSDAAHYKNMTLFPVMPFVMLKRTF
jgi:hypothetical protein